MTSKVIHAIDHGSVQHSFLFAYTTYVSLSSSFLYPFVTLNIDSRPTRPRR